MTTDDGYTEQVSARAGPNADKRAVEVFSSLIRHLHAFAREVQLTNEEWLLACQKLIEAGQISGSERNEMILISDVLGIEALIDTMAHERYMKAAGVSAEGATAASTSGGQDAALTSNAPPVTLSAILGPFYREGAPRYKNGESIVKTHEEGDVTAHVFGRVMNAKREPIAGAEVHIWHDGSKGFYDSQLYDPKQPDKHPYMNWRGIFTTDEEGRYDVNALRPTAYPIPYDNTAGAILKAMDNSPMRPAHIHFLIKAPGYRPLVTQVYDANDKWIDSDSVFGVKDSLKVRFEECKDGKADSQLECNIVLVEAKQ